VLRTGEVPLTGGLILKEPKGKSKRTIPVPAELVAVLRAHREVQDLEKQFAAVYTDHDLVFARADGSPIDPAEDWAEWKALLDIAGLPSDIRVHDGRHTAITLLLAQGMKIEVVQELAGHSSIVVTRGYGHLVAEMAREGVAELGKKLLRGSGTP
jgi:integrase